MHCLPCVPVLGKQALLSSTYTNPEGGFHKASNAIDGVYRPQANVPEWSSIAHSKTEDNPWWRVDLFGVRCIWAVNILNRGDCKYIFRGFNRTKKIFL